MTSYRRNFVPGGSYFFTVDLADRRSHLLTEHIDLLRTAFRDVRSRHPFAMEAVVVLPDHLHAIWTLPEGDENYATRWRLIKATFSRVLRLENGYRPAAGVGAKWQRRYWEHTLRDDADFTRHADYIHFNPIKHGHVGRVKDWPYSSFHRMVRLGVCPEDWAGDVWSEDVSFGER